MNYTYSNIDNAIASYTGVGGSGPLNAEQLATIYGARVQQLIALRDAGFTAARWGWDDALGHNRWHGVQ